MFFKKKKAKTNQIQTINLPTNLKGISGIIALPVKESVIYDPLSSTILCIQDSEKNIVDLSRIEQPHLEVRVGAVNTSYGIIGYMLFVICDLRNQTDKFTYEVLINPGNISTYKEYLSIDKQNCWEVFVVHGSSVLNIFTFDNVYNIGEGINEALKACETKPCIDFDSAKQEYFSLYSIEELLEM